MLFRKGLLLFTLIAAFVATTPTSFAQNDVSSDLDKLEKFLVSIDQKYVDEVETKAIVEEGIREMLEQLDPHSVYLDKEAYRRANEPLKGKFTGVGVRFLMINDTMQILELIPGGPAEKAGLQRGDQIVAIDGDTVSGRSLNSRNISKKIKTSDKPTLRFDIVRSYPESTQLALSLERDVVEVSSVPASLMLDNRTGYIKLDRFSATSFSDFREGLESLKKERVKNLILDLRGNGGGYLNMAIKIADEFLDDRKLIVYTEGTHQDRRETFANSGGRFTNGDLYLLIDANSASASEILAGAIQDLDRGLIIGRRSYGKGLVQRTVEFSDGSAMRLTISRYYTPTGRSIQRPYDEGVEAYRGEIALRRSNGELISADSIDYSDSLVFYTPSKRKVYGGGGIIPDVFVSLDTSRYSDLVSEIRAKGLFDGFALKVAERNELSIMAEYTEPTEFLAQFELNDDYVKTLSSYVTQRGIALNEESILSDKEDISRLVKISMARYIYGPQAYYLARAVYDRDVNVALHQIEEGTVKELGLR